MITCRTIQAQSLAPAEPDSKYLFGTEISTDGAKADNGKPRTDKRQYNLFNPTPDDLLRPFSSSRPDQTTGLHSVDAGHYYLETGTAYSLGLGATRTDTWNYFQSTHVRAGLLNNVELELIWAAWTRPARAPSGQDRPARGARTATPWARRI